MELGNLIFGHSRGLYPIERKSFEEFFGQKFTELLDAVHCDSYGHYMGNNPAFKSLLGGFKCEFFEINPYYWGECDCDASSGSPHKSYCSLNIPNFVYRVKGGKDIEIRWYKYPFRDSYSNVKISDELFSSIMSNCMDYVKSLTLKEQDVL